MANPAIVIQAPTEHTRWMKVKANILKSPMMVSSLRHPDPDKSVQNVSKWKRVSSAVLAASRGNNSIYDTGNGEPSTSKRPTIYNSNHSLCSNQSNNSRFSVRRGSIKRTGSGSNSQKRLLPGRLVVKAWEEPGMLGKGQVEDTVIAEISGKRRDIVGLELIHKLFQIWQPQLAKSWRPPAKPEIPPMMLRYRTRSHRARPPTPKHEQTV